MEKPITDNRIVMTLDAGGTNLVFSAVRNEQLIVEPITLPSSGNNLDKCLQAMVQGFETVASRLPEPAVAISFAFEINARLAEMGSPKRYGNLIGYTFGTGFGVGIISGGRLHIGDNSCVETFCLRNSVYPDMISEATVSAGGIRREYARLSGIDDPSLETKDIYDIADGIRSGNREAALKAFEIFGMAAGDAIATAASLIDGIVVLGGGVARGNKFFMSALLGQMRSKLRNYNGEELSRVQPQVYNLDDEAEFALFARGGAQKLQVYGSERMVDYDPQKRIGVTVSRVGSSRAIQLGAAAYALNRIDGK